MKRFAALLVTLSLFVPLVAHATGLKLVTRDWQFHTSVGTVAEGGPGYAAGDSFFVTRGTGIENSAEQADTTKAIAWTDWTFPGPLYGTSVAADTIGVLIADLYSDVTTPTVAGDTVGVKLQVSDDSGITWTNVVWTGPRIDPDVAAMAQSAWLETGTSNTFHVVIRCVVGGAVAGGFVGLNTAPTALQTYGYQLFRLIFTGDHTGKYKLRLTGWVNGDD